MENYSKLLKRFFYAPIETRAVYYIYCRLFWEHRVKLISYYYKSKLAYKYGIHMRENCKIGKDLLLPHPQGIVIGDCTIIGDNCTIYQQVTIGRLRKENIGGGRYTPHIGSNCVLYPGAKVIGKITVRNNTVVAVQAVLRNSTEVNSVYAGIPAKRIK